MPAVVALAVEGPARDLLIRIAPPLAISAASIAGLALNVGLNFAAVPALGISGASLASVLSYWLAGGLMLYLLSRYGDVPMRRALRLPAPRRRPATPAFARAAPSDGLTRVRDRRLGRGDRRADRETLRGCATRSPTAARTPPATTSFPAGWRSAFAAWRSSTSRPATSRSRRGLGASRSPATARSTTSARCATELEPAATRSAPPRTPR